MMDKSQKVDYDLVWSRLNTQVQRTEIINYRTRLLTFAVLTIVVILLLFGAALLKLESRVSALEVSSHTGVGTCSDVVADESAGSR